MDEVKRQEMVEKLNEAIEAGRFMLVLTVKHELESGQEDLMHYRLLHNFPIPDIVPSLEHNMKEFKQQHKPKLVDKDDLHWR